MSTEPVCVISIRPKEGKFTELLNFVSPTLKEIQENVAGVVHAYEFVVSGKEEVIVLERFRSNNAMFNYFNSDYHEGLVNKLLPLAQEPIDIRSSANLDQLQDWKSGSQGGHFTV
ncbi:hypothetical protein BGW36DRAFT_427470 [Talaromyces proteolyticus]|uniref:ABM domain-containing protein n=1 Tax=Talaromyces proteolyticus TaxID=1131652 RepID=A0AAD4KSR4_9EURO|nr:uncharacterized protein BGW36DRAFT_427470 [Talaromyces proteolyticus]KAH8697512.1 hypothetical protein BGW36DRAFT_427470 [Talaromyces proteolyticus]